MDVGVVGERMRKDRRGAWRVEEGREGRAGAVWGLRLEGAELGAPPGIRAEATAGPVALTVTLHQAGKDTPPWVRAPLHTGHALDFMLPLGQMFL